MASEVVVITSFFLAFSGVLFAAPKVLPVLNAPISDYTVNANAAAQNIDLASIFGTEEIDDKVVRFISQTSNGSRVMEFAMFSNRTPGTRSNFLKYVDDGDYERSIIHRSVPNFVIQGGGVRNASAISGPLFESVPTDAPIVNEFGISNSYGTVSMAKSGEDPDSATSQWFVSLADNSANLDNQNGGFTVFARVTKSTLISAEEFSRFPVWNVVGILEELPLIPSFDGTGYIAATDLILFPTVSLVDISADDAGESSALDFSIVSNSNSALVSASISLANELQISYSPDSWGSSTLTVRTTDSKGNTVDDTFTVSVEQTYQAWRNVNFSTEDAANDSVSGLDVDANQDGLNNFELYIHSLPVSGSQQSPITFSTAQINSIKYPSFTFPLINSTSAINYQLQESTDLGVNDTWKNVEHTLISSTDQGVTKLVTLRGDEVITTGKKFYRLQFSETQ